MDAYDHIYKWMEWLRVNKAPRTTEAYATTMGLWVGWCDAKNIEPLSPALEDLEAFVARTRSNGRKGKPATREFDVYVLKSWFTWLAQRGYITGNPALNLQAPKVNNMNPRPIPDADWLVLWQHDMTDRMRLVYGMAYYAGLRRVELQHLRVDQVTQEKLRHVLRKGGDEQSIPWHRMATIVATRKSQVLPDITRLEHTVARIRRQHGFNMIFPWPDLEQFNKNMTTLCRRVGIPHYSPHQLRHSAVTNLIECDVPLHLVSRMMGHKTIDTTMLYVKAGADELDQWWAHEENDE